MTTTPVYNPWRESLENCIEGSNYLRASEYRTLIAELDDLYARREQDAASPHPEPESAAPAVSDEVDRRDTLERAWAAFCQKHDAPAHYLIPEDRLKNSLRAALYAALPALTAQVASLVAELRGLEKECRERGSGLTAQQLRAILSRYPEAK